MLYSLAITFVYSLHSFCITYNHVPPPSFILETPFLPLLLLQLFHLHFCRRDSRDSHLRSWNETGVVYTRLHICFRSLGLTFLQKIRLLRERVLSKRIVSRSCLLIFRLICNYLVVSFDFIDIIKLIYIIKRSLSFRENYI